MIFSACPRKDVPPNPRVGVGRAPAKTNSSHQELSFDAQRAMKHVRQQLEYGPRPADSEPLEKTRQYIIRELKSYGLLVSLDEFTATTPKGPKKMTNIIGEIPGETHQVVLICSHYDTKLFDDMHFVGANDPATSVATLLEIGRVLGRAVVVEKPKVTLRLVFFDGEEAFCEGWDDCKNADGPDNTYGSRRYVAQIKQRNEVNSTRAMILLDMIGYQKLELGRDSMSTRWLQDIIWKTGRELGHKKIFVDREEGVGGDDHEPFLEAGIPAVDLIQLNSYPYWHRADDTIDKVSAESMKIVGETVLASLPKIAERVSKQ
jgi:glutaminyl-peptide cyclotransferase